MMWLILATIILFLSYYLLSKKYSYWKDIGVPGPKPSFIVGNIGPALVGKQCLGDIFTEIYRQYEDYAFVGVYRATTPCLLIRDPQFVKKILVSDFKHFQNNDVELDKNVDRIMSRNPFFMKGSEWKQKRAVLTTCFTSGKMKGMFPLLNEASKRMVKYLEDNASCSLESRDICNRFTLDNVASCAFGLEGKSFDEKYSQFMDLADNFFSTGSWSSVPFLFKVLFPQLGSFLKIGFINADVENRLIDMVTDSLNHRRESKIVRNDFLEYVNEVVHSSNLFEDEIDTAAQAATFFADGYETSSRVMSFVLFALASNVDAQEKLRNEIEGITEKYKGKITYEGVQDMIFLDACINESMRKYPIAGQLFKKCTEKFTYTPDDPGYKRITVTLEPGTVIILPLAGLQGDKKYFEDPEKYRPERFLTQEIPNKYAFRPFGDGPRTCLGKRFAITQIKLGVLNLVKNFKISVNQRTELPLKYDPWFLLSQPIGGLWLDFKKITLPSNS